MAQGSFGDETVRFLETRHRGLGNHQNKSHLGEPTEEEVAVAVGAAAAAASATATTTTATTTTHTTHTQKHNNNNNNRGNRDEGWGTRAGLNLLAHSFHETVVQKEKKYQYFTPINT